MILSNEILHQRNPSKYEYYHLFDNGDVWRVKWWSIEAWQFYIIAAFWIFNIETGSQKTHIPIFSII